MSSGTTYVGNAKRANFYTDDANVIAFSKDAKCWAAFNNGTEAKEIRVQTGLPAGTYCDIIHDKDSGKACNGPKVVVTSNGLATVTGGAKDAVAFTRADRISNVNCQAAEAAAWQKCETPEGFPSGVLAAG